MNPITLPPEKFAEFLKKRREALWKLEPEVRGKNNRSYLSSSSVKRNMQRRRTP